MKAKTALAEATLIDALVVCQGLDDSEREQIEVLSGAAHEPQETAMQLMSTPGVKWSCREIETGEPLVVGGYVQVAPTVWRSFMLVTKRAWVAHGVEISLHARSTIKGFIEQQTKLHPYIRLETICLSDRHKARDWYGKIGLSYESDLKGYGVNGETAVMYIKTVGAEGE